MSDRNETLMLEDIIDAIDKIFLYTEGMSFEQYSSNELVQDAVERNFEIVGEAASRIGDDFRQKFSSIDFRLLKDFRNVIIHRYFDVRQEILWNAKEYELADLKQKIQNVLQQLL